MRDPVRIWDAALGELRLGMSQANYESYLAGTSATEFEDDELTVAVSNPLVRETLEQRFRQHILRALYDVVLAAQAAAIERTRPGARFIEPHDAAVRVLAQGMIDHGLVAGSLDKVVSVRAVEGLAGELRTGSFVLVPGARHEVLMERDKLREQYWAAFDAFVPGS